MSASSAPALGPLRAVLFTGGRGSSALTRRLLQLASVTIAINGYDDGASTGEVRRFLGRALGPSDFRKNVSRVSAALGTAPEALLALLDARLPAPCSPSEGQRLLECVQGGQPSDSAFELDVVNRVRMLPIHARSTLTDAVRAFERERQLSGRAFRFDDASLGNIVFAGLYLLAGGDFNAAVDRYAALCGLPTGLIENVTDGSDAYLVAIDFDGRLLPGEEEIVRAKAATLRDIFLLDHRLAPHEIERLARLPEPDLSRALASTPAALTLNPRLAAKLAEADLIVYAPGTQHSSLFPSYLTPGLGTLIAANTRAYKVLITNLQPDQEMQRASSVEIAERALFYLREKGVRPHLTPTLITHCLFNEPRKPDGTYVLPGPLDRIGDLRLVRLADYEAGATGQHDPAKVLDPVLDELLRRRARPRVAVLLTDSEDEGRIAQTLVEMVRGGVPSTPVDLRVYYARRAPVDDAFVHSVPFDVRHLDTASGRLTDLFAEACARWPADYVALFDSSGMYNGEDFARVASLLASGRHDAVWGSRRLSVREIHASYRLRYRQAPWLGAISYIGSHLLSVAYLLRYNRYLTDTLCEVRAFRASFLPGIDVLDPLVNHRVLPALLQQHAEVVEIPVQFLPLSPASVRRTTVANGFRALGAIVMGRTARRPQTTETAAPAIGHLPAQSRSVEDSAPRAAQLVDTGRAASGDAAESIPHRVSDPRTMAPR